MVNLKAFPGISAQVYVDGKPLKEYTDDTIEDEEGTVTRYIEAVSDKNFEICLEVKKGTKITRSAVSFRVEVDGMRIKKPIMSIADFKNEDGRRVVEGRIDENDQVQTMSFTTLETANDGRMFHVEASRVKVLGTISVDIEFKDTKGPSTKPARFSLKESGIVSEKALKGEVITHGVNFGKPVARRNATNYVTSCNVDSVNKFKIMFKYRSLEALKQMYIIPRTPSPPPIERRAPGSLSHEEIAEMRKQLLNANAKNDSILKIKRERRDDNPRPRKIARPSAGDTLLAIDDENGVRELSTATLEREEKEIIELD